MHSLHTLSCAVLAACPFLFAADAPPQLIHKVDPNEGISKIGVVFHASEVQLIVDEAGVPFSFESSAPLPDYVVKALEQWRYSPYEKNGKVVAFTAKLSVPFAEPITPEMERRFVPHWRPESTEVSDALALGRKLDESAATALEANLPDAEALGNPRTSLLVYYTNHAATNPDTARAGRAKLLTWLVAHYPQDDILGSSYALINRAGEPLADAATRTAMIQLWLDAVKQNPEDDKVAAHALNFFQVTSPNNAIAILNKLPRWKEMPRWAGAVYGLSALGVTALDPITGKPSVAAEGLSKAVVRDALLKSQDTTIVLGGLWSMTAAARALAESSHVPADYDAFCQSLLKRAKELYPATTQSCDLAPRPEDKADDEPSQFRIGGSIAQAQLLKRVPPSYPAEAKHHGVQGTVSFTAIVDRSGKIKQLEAQSGPFLLYSSSLQAVRQWQYKPTLLNGKPVEIVTNITVNYALGR